MSYFILLEIYTEKKSAQVIDIIPFGLYYTAFYVLIGISKLMRRILNTSIHPNRFNFRLDEKYTSGAADAV